MRIKFLLIALIFSFFSFTALAVSTDDADVSVAIFPGTFHLTIFGDLVTGIDLEGLLPAGVMEQTGFWNATDGEDYLVIFDSTEVDGYRLQFFLGGDFVYDGVDPGQADIPASDFKVYADWNVGGDSALAPTIGTDDLTKTLSIDSSGSCGLAVPAEYSFNADFSSADFAINFSLAPFDYLTSTVSCVNEIALKMGRFELDLGVPSAGEYGSSLFVVMVDG